MRRLIPASCVVAFVALLLPNCSGGSCGIFVAVALDVRGASNTACTLTLERKDNKTSFDIAAPMPAVADTSLGPRAPILDARACQLDGGTTAALTPSAPGNSAFRTSTTLCIEVQGLALYQALGADCSGDSNVLLTLVCAGATLYDRVPHPGCECFG